MLKRNLNIARFALTISFLNLLLFHLPFYTFVFNHIDYTSLNGVILIVSLIILMIAVKVYILLLY